MGVIVIIIIFLAIIGSGINEVDKERCKRLQRENIKMQNKILKEQIEKDK